MAGLGSSVVRAPWVLLPALAILAGALWVRYALVENPSFALDCARGQTSLLCPLRLATVTLFNASAFGLASLAAAVLTLVRPGLVTFAAGLVAAAGGLVLYNVSLSGLALALLVLALARPVG